MKIELGKIVDAIPVLRTFGDRDLPVPVSVQVIDLLESLIAKASTWEKQRNKLFEQLGADRPATPEEKANGQPDTLRHIPKENQPEFFKRLKKLNETEVELVFTPIDMGLMGKEDRIKPNDLVMLRAFALFGDKTKD